MSDDMPRLPAVFGDPVQARANLQVVRDRHLAAHPYGSPEGRGMPPDVPPPTEPPNERGAAAPTTAAPPRALIIESLADVYAEVLAAPPPTFLFRRVWAADAYGVVAAEDKAGKSWMMADATVSVASGTPWVDHFECDTPGPVLVFVGEGGKRKTIRRLEAVCAARGLTIADIADRVRLCFRVPHLTSDQHLAVITAELEEFPAQLVIIDPLYLAARGARGSDLYEMGALLEDVQHVCQDAGAALIVVTHWNKSGDGRGAKRMTGVGPGAWGRVLVSGAVEKTETDPDTLESTVTIEWEFTGDELAAEKVHVRRRVRAEDPQDLASPLHYSTEIVSPAGGSTTATMDMRPSRERVLRAVHAAGEPVTAMRIVADVAADGKPDPPAEKTVRTALGELRKDGLVDRDPDGEGAARWRMTDRGLLLVGLV